MPASLRTCPALKVAEHLAARHGSRIRIVEPYASELPRSLAQAGAQLIDIDTAIDTCPVFVVLVDHEVFKSIPLSERGAKLVYDTRGIWPDQPPGDGEAPSLRLAG